MEIMGARAHFTSGPTHRGSQPRRRQPDLSNTHQDRRRSRGHRGGFTGLLSWSAEAQAVLARAGGRARLQGGRLAVFGLAPIPAWQTGAATCGILTGCWGTRPPDLLQEACAAPRYAGLVLRPGHPGGRTGWQEGGRNLPAGLALA